MRAYSKIAISVMAAMAATTSVNTVVAQEVADGSLEEIVVTGIRASLEAGLSKKEQANSIVDGAFAEELGKFPDTNVAESLQRITGVAITRSRGGEGQFVTVRGLGEEFNAVTYNGRILATENQGREFSFDVIASELISAAEVYKTTTASQTEGSIGGLINIRSALPLDNPGFHAAGKLASQYEELADSFGSRASGVVSNTWVDDTVGVLASFSYQQRDSRTDVAESIFTDTDAGDNNGDGVAGERLNSFVSNVAFQERERTGGTLAFQYTPSDDTEIVVDALYTKFESPSRVNGYSFFPSASALTPGSVSVDSNNVIVSQTTPGAVADFVSRLNIADTDTMALGANLKHQFSDNLAGKFDLSWSKSEGQRDNVGSSSSGSGIFYVLGVPGSTFSQSPGGAVPNVSFTAPGANGGQVPFSQVSADQLRLHFSRNAFIETTDEVSSVKADFIYDFSDNAQLEFGVSYIDREKSNQAFDNSATWCGDSATLFFCGYNTPLSSFANTSNALTFFDDGLLDGNGGGRIPGVIPIVSVETITEAFNNIGARFGIPSFLSVAPNLAASNVIDESVLAAYMQTNFAGELGSIPFSANAGVRLAWTDLKSVGVGAEITGAVFEPAGAGLDPTQSFDVNQTAPINAENDYFDLLPSFNITFDLTDNSKLRSSFQQTLTRPTLVDLATFFQVGSSNVGAESISQSNPELDPVRSNNFDVSYEYYGDDGVSYSIAGFYKDISDFITNQNVTETIVIDNVRNTRGVPVAPISRDFLVSGPQNGDEAEVYGVELAAQYLMDSGFGIAANVTFSESEATLAGEKSDLENISDFSANFSVFYEANNIQARASLNHRGEYLDTTEGESGLSEFVDDYTQVDLSFGYNIGEAMGSDSDVVVFLEGINVLDEPFFRYAESRSLLEAYEVNGARWVFGVRAAL